MGAGGGGRGRLGGGWGGQGGGGHGGLGHRRLGLRADLADKTVPVLPEDAVLARTSREAHEKLTRIEMPETRKARRRKKAPVRGPGPTAENGGFEPPRALTQHAFQACAIGR